jgi:hypothetical protein
MPIKNNVLKPFSISLDFRKPSPQAIRLPYPEPVEVVFFNPFARSVCQKPVFQSVRPEPVEG